jgi:hypothetical protein
MKIIHHPSDMNTSEHYTVFDPTLAGIVTVWVSKLGHARTLSCDHCKVSHHRGTCPHIDAVTGKTTA